jgi:hypothetical protein
MRDGKIANYGVRDDVLEELKSKSSPTVTATTAPTSA